LRRYTTAPAFWLAPLLGLAEEGGESAAVVGYGLMVWRCRLTPSKPVLKVPIVSALDTIIP